MRKKIIASNFLPSTIILFSFALFLQTRLTAQNTRLDDHNSIGWFTYTGTFKIGPRFGIHTEYQCRRDEYVNNWQQSLFRTGINYTVNPKLVLRLGYANIETYNYGDYPINSMGRNFTEHRIYEMATISDKMGLVDISHRFILEQRWLGRYTIPALEKENDWPYLNRLRYMVRMQLPLKGKIIADRTPYFAAYDEICIGFGKNVNENIFDQNRIGLLLGYRLSSVFKIEAGFLSQVLQFGREINGNNVFQYNTGFILSTVFNFDLTRNR